EPQRGERRSDRQAVAAAEEAPPERQVLRDGERRLHWIEMADEMCLLGQRELAVATEKAGLPLHRPQQASKQPQQRRLTRPVRTSDDQGRAGRHTKADAGEDLAASPY